MRSAPWILTREERASVEAVLRDRLGMDARMIAIDERVLGIRSEIRTLRETELELIAERERLMEARARVSDAALAEKWGVAANTIRDMTKGR